MLAPYLSLTRLSKETPQHHRIIIAAAYYESPFPDQPYEIIVGSKAGQPLVVTEVGRHGGYAQLPGPLPVGIHCPRKAPLRKDRLRFITRQPDGSGDPQQHIHQRQVAPFDEIGLVDGMAEEVARTPRLGPFTQFLSQSAVAGACPPCQRQSFSRRSVGQPDLHGLYLDLTAAKQFGEFHPFLRGFRVEWKDAPLQPDPEFSLQTLGTHGTQIAPRSDIVEKNLYHGGCVHGSPLLCCVI